MNIGALLSSKNGNYCTPPRIIGRVHRFLRAKHEAECRAAGVEPVPGVVPFFDPFTNVASIVGARWSCDITKGQDGNAADWGARKRPHAERAFVYENPEYGDAIIQALATTHRFGRELRTAEIVALLPARPDTQWFQRYVFGSADAWVWVEGRLTFWLPIPIEDPRPWDRRRPIDPKRKRGKDEEPDPVFLQRWWPGATDESLPEPFRLLEPGIAIGPELGSNGKESPAPFPSMIPYWGDDLHGFARFFGGLGTLVVDDRHKIPTMPDESLLAECPPDVAAWVRAAGLRKAGVYQRARDGK